MKKDVVVEGSLEEVVLEYHLENEAIVVYLKHTDYSKDVEMSPLRYPSASLLISSRPFVCRSLFSMLFHVTFRSCVINASS